MRTRSAKMHCRYFSASLVVCLSVVRFSRCVQVDANSGRLDTLSCVTSGAKTVILLFGNAIVWRIYNVVCAYMVEIISNTKRPCTHNGWRCTM